MTDWKQRWEPRHPDPYWCSRRRDTIEDILEYLRANEGYLGEIRIQIRDGSLSVNIDGGDSRGSHWYIQDGILPTECDSIRSLLSQKDDESIGWLKGDLVGATLATVLHLYGVANPIARVNRIREQHCLADWLDNISSDSGDAWDAIAQQAEAIAEQLRFDAQFPPNGPSGEFIERLFAEDWDLDRVLERARAGGYTGTRGALRAKRSHFRQRLDSTKHEAHAPVRPESEPVIQSADASGTVPTVAYLRERNEPVSVDSIAVRFSLDPEETLKLLKSRPDRFAMTSDGRWTLVSHQ